MIVPTAPTREAARIAPQSQVLMVGDKAPNHLNVNFFRFPELQQFRTGNAGVMAFDE